MRASLLPFPSPASTLVYKSLVLLAGVVVGLSPLALSAQSVTFAGAQSTVPVSGLSSPQQIAIDTAGNLFVADAGLGQVVELPLTPRGYGLLTPLASNLNYPTGVAVDSAGNVFIAAGIIFELPRTKTGYDGPLTSLPVSPYYPTALAVDGADNVFDSEAYGAYEYPLTPEGYGPQILVLTDNYYPDEYANHGIAVDSAGDAFILDQNYYGAIVGMPKTATGFGPETPLIAASSPGIAVDSAGDVFSGLVPQVTELPRTAMGYGSPITLPAKGLGNFQGLAVDALGDVFISDTDNSRVVELQTRSVNFYGVNACGSGQTTPAPCSETLTLTFNVNAGVTLGTPKVLTGGAPGLDFTLATGSTCIGAVAAGSSCTVNVTFTPLAVGVKTGSVEITDGGGNVLTTTTISGTGLPVAAGSPVAQVSPPVLQFDPIGFGSAESLPLMITNTGGGVLTFSASINGQSYGFDGSTCGLGITPGNSCTLDVQFTPAAVGIHNNILTLETNAPSSVAVNLKGTALGASTTTKELDFGTIPLGSTKVLNLSFTNTATSGTVMLGAVTTGPSYKILTTTQNTCQSGVAAGHSCILPVQFSPAVVGPVDDFLNLTPNADAPPSFVRLNGSASGVSTQQTAPLTFPVIPNHTTEVLPLTITNVGVPGTVTIGTAINGNSFEVLTTSDNTCQAGISDGQTCTLPVQFSPMSVGAHNEQLTLLPSTGAASIVHLDGTASGVPLDQIVTFTGAQTGITFDIPGAVAADGAGDVFVIFDYANSLGFGVPNLVSEFPLTATGYGPEPTVLNSGTDYLASVATDGAGDLFVAESDSNRVLELPKTPTGFGTPTAVVSGLNGAIAADSAGDVFVLANNEIFEVPKTTIGYGSQVSLPITGLKYAAAIAADSAGDVFIADAGNDQVVELPRTVAGYGTQKTVATGLIDPGGIAIDALNDIFLTVAPGIVVELPLTISGYGPPLTVLSPGAPYNAGNVAAYGAGIVFASEGGYPYYPGGGPVVEVQTRSVNFTGANICAPGQTTPAPCSQMVAFTFNVNVDATLGATNVLTGGAPNLDFTLASGSNCTGAMAAGTICTVNVIFAPLAAGIRNGSVQITDGTGTVLTAVAISGTGLAD